MKNRDDAKKIAKFYDNNTQREWNRLTRDPYHTIEFLVNMHYIEKYFPPQGKLLDAGGGPGRYAVELCKKGYEVVLLDLSPGNIASAEERFQTEAESVRSRFLEFMVGDVRDLSNFGSDHFDAVLCLDPLSYITNKEEQMTAASELVRVAKVGAPVFISARGYLAVLRTILARFSNEIAEPRFQTLITQGDTSAGGIMCHFFRSAGLRSLAESCGLETLEMAGCQGLSTGLQEATNAVRQDEVKWERWVDLVLRTCAEPAVVDMAEHILYVGRKSQKS